MNKSKIKYILSLILLLGITNGISIDYGISTNDTDSIGFVYVPPITNNILINITNKTTNTIPVTSTITVLKTNYTYSTNYIVVNLTNTVPNVPPIVTLTGPSNNSSYLSPANITISANASDSDGSISKVEFYSNGSLINTLTSLPYTYNFITNAGNYSFQAKAYDNSNGVTASLISSVIVTNPPTGNNWYVKDNGTSGATGKDWNNAWNINTINWSSVQPGDTIWLAGGSYNSGFKTMKNGAANKYIYIKRVTASDVLPINSPGYSLSFDSQVIISGNPVWFDKANTGSYLYFDGGKADGMKFSFPGTSFGSSAVFFSAGGMHDIVFNNIDMVGPGGITAYNYPADCSVIGLRPQISGGGNIYNVTVSNSKLHGGPNLVYNLGANYNFRFINSKFYDNGSANASIHANMVYTAGGNYDWYFINCEFWNWQVEGINLYQQTNHPHYIIGCVFRDPMTTGARCFWWANESGSPTGPIYLYNNTFVGVNITIPESRASMATSSSKARNNIYWNSSFAGISSITDSDYNFSNGSTPGANSIGAGLNPFINESANDFRIISTIGNKYPKNKGIILSIPYLNDFYGNLRGQDGFWDIGAFEN